MTMTKVTMSRAYTVQELDALRTLVERKYLYGTYGMPPRGMSRSYREDEKAKTVEEMVRTHMLAGHTAGDLLASESDSHGEQARKQEG
jgi:hypothetical protein